MITETEIVTVSTRIPSELKDYLNIASFKLKVKKGELVAEALRLHRQYMITSGQLREEEV